MFALKNILVATDFSQSSAAALNYGRELARTFGGQLDLLHVVENMFTAEVGADVFSSPIPACKRVCAPRDNGESMSCSGPRIAYNSVRRGSS